MSKFYHLISLGCPKNLIDSETFAFLTEEAGYLPTEDSMKAHLIIINTCGFINSAKEEGIDTIFDAAKLKTEGNCQTLIVTGCLVKRYFDQLKHDIPEIDVLVNLKDFKNFAQILGLKDFAYNRKLMTPKHYAYLRISDGCNNNCTYCAIPLIRGSLKSIPMEDIISEANKLASEGVKEIIITAQDTTQYGIDLYHEQRLITLLKEIAKIDDIKWIRLLYLHPAHISHDLVDAIAEIPKILHYFDIPLQHISDNVMRAMNRRKFSQHCTDIISYIKDKMPDAILRTTFIVGFPGEKRNDYEQLKRFVIEQKFGRMGIFTYSEEEDTAAVNFADKVTRQTALNRYNKLMEIQQAISADVMETFLGKEIDCIIDKEADEQEFDFEARSWFDAPDVDGIVFVKDPNNIAKAGDIVTVKVIDSWEYDLVGEVISIKN
jgi:ribosomal protein S12 methylthiotransferase